MTKSIVAPSILSMDFSNINHSLQELKEANIQMLHYDVMDGHFVENISFGEPLLKYFLNKGFTLDIHLMVTNPLKQLQRFLALDPNCQISVHYEAIEDNIEEFLQQSEEARKKNIIGLALNPDTSLEEAAPYFHFFKKIMVMSVYPGASGKAYVEGSDLRVKKINEILETLSPKPLLEIDGGINNVTGPKACKAGATILVSGSYFFKAKEKRKAILEILGA